MELRYDDVMEFFNNQASLLNVNLRMHETIINKEFYFPKRVYFIIEEDLNTRGNLTEKTFLKRLDKVMKSMGTIGIVIDRKMIKKGSYSAKLIPQPYLKHIEEIFNRLSKAMKSDTSIAEEGCEVELKKYNLQNSYRYLQGSVLVNEIQEKVIKDMEIYVEQYKWFNNCSGLDKSPLSENIENLQNNQRIMKRFQAWLKLDTDYDKSTFELLIKDTLIVLEKLYFSF